MSRKGKSPIAIPKGVEVSVKDGSLSVKGPKGHMTKALLPYIDLTIEGGQILVTLKPEHEGKKNFHGLGRALVQNMVTGVAEGYEKKLEMIGVGYRAAVKGKDLDIQIGFSHPTLVPIPTTLQVSVDKNTTIVIKGIDKQEVGQLAALIRAIRPPEVYQGKGIRYQGEYVRKKAGKAAAKTA